MEHDGVALEVEAGVGVAGEEVELGSWKWCFASGGGG